MAEEFFYFYLLNTGDIAIQSEEHIVFKSDDSTLGTQETDTQRNLCVLRLNIDICFKLAINKTSSLFFQQLL